jgi:hypothetical protein
VSQKDDFSGFCLTTRAGFPLIPGKLLQQSIEFFQASIFDDDPPAAVVIFNRHLEAQGAL